MSTSQSLDILHFSRLLNPDHYKIADDDVNDDIERRHVLVEQIENITDVESINLLAVLTTKSMCCISDIGGPARILSFISPIDKVVGLHIRLIVARTGIGGWWGRRRWTRRDRWQD